MAAIPSAATQLFAGDGALSAGQALALATATVAAAVTLGVPGRAPLMARDRELLDEQIAYYRARAAEYDATSMPPGDPFAAHAEAIRDALRAFAPRGRVLELAAGTGQWTGLLADYADELTRDRCLAGDARAQPGEGGRARQRPLRGGRRVRAGARRTPSTSSSSASSCPTCLPSRFEAFWGVVEGLLAPGGRVFFVDEGRHFLWREDWIDEAAGIVRRPLPDGTVHRAVKVLWEPDDLAGAARRARLGRIGRPSEGPFYWGTAAR